VKVTSVELYEVLASASAGGTPINHVLRDNRGLAPRQYRPWPPHRPVRSWHRRDGRKHPPSAGRPWDASGSTGGGRL